MGKITVVGCAKKEVTYDLVTITLTFKAKEKTSARASEEVIKKSEAFLKQLSAKGIPLENISLKEDRVEKSYYDRNEDWVSAKRGISITTQFSMDFMNFIMELIKKQSGEIEYHTEYSLSNHNQIHTALLQEAIQDSKKKAEGIAESLGQSVAGLKTASTLHSGVAEEFLNCMQLNDCEEDDFCEQEYVSDALKAPTTIEVETVEAVWIIG